MGTNVDEQMNPSDTNHQNTMINAEFGARMLNMVIHLDLYEVGSL